MEPETRVVGFRRAGAPFAVGTLAVLGTLPGIAAALPLPVPQWLVVVGVIVVGVVGVGLATTVGAVLAPDVDLRTLAPDRLPGGGVRAYRLPAAVGVGVAVGALGLHTLIVTLGGDPGPGLPALWRGESALVVLGRVAGGVLAELVLRFGVMTGVVWTAWTYRPALDHGVTRSAAWTGIVAAAAVGGVALFPLAVVAGTGPSVVGVGFTVGGGVVFGLLYWRYDLAAAVVAHGVASLVRAVVVLG